jgi:hypothetical protein
MAARVYATLAQLTSYVPAGTILPAEPEATRVLTSASKVITRATMTGVYQTDAFGYPTDPDVRRAFQDATCAQVHWWTITLDEAGYAGQFQHVYIGSVQLTRGGGRSLGGSGGVPGQDLAPMADTELRTAGVLPGSIVGIQTWEGGWI